MTQFINRAFSDRNYKCIVVTIIIVIIVLFDYQFDTDAIVA